MARDNNGRPPRSRRRGSSYDSSPRIGARGDVRQSSAKRDDHRFRAVMVFAIGLALIAIVRLLFLHVFDAPTNNAKLDARRASDIVLHSKRGTIYDRNGNVLAMSLDCSTITTNASLVDDANKAASLCKEILGGNEDSYRETFAKDSTFEYVQKRVDTETAQKLLKAFTDAGLKGLYLVDDTMRVYPYGSVGGQILGMVGSDGEGITGLESYYNDVLAGKDGTLHMEVSATTGAPIAGSVYEINDAQDGTDIMLSLDIDVQRVAEENIVQAVKDYQAGSGMVMATDPKTGEILAACSTPLADLTSPSSLSNDALSLSLVSQSYEPGSIFKCLTMAVGIDNGVLNPNTTFTVPATVKAGSDDVRDDDGRDYTMDMTCREILRRSSNTGAILCGETIGADAFAAGVSQFGIGSKTGIDYPGEVEGLVTQRENYSGATLGAMSFGQALAVPMVQMVRAMGAVANGGTLYTPHFLLSKGGEQVTWDSQGQACTQRAASQVTDMMRTVVQEGTAVNAQVQGYDVAGKTGTGEQSNEHGYVENSYLASLVGFANADNAEVLVYVGLNNTPYLAYASAAPTFSAIMGEALLDLGIQPSS